MMRAGAVADVYKRQPLMSFDNAMPTYQVLKNLLKKNPEISFDKDKFIAVSYTHLPR